MNIFARLDCLPVWECDFRFFFFDDEDHKGFAFSFSDLRLNGEDFNSWEGMRIVLAAWNYEVSFSIEKDWGRPYIRAIKRPSFACFFAFPRIKVDGSCFSHWHWVKKAWK